MQPDLKSDDDILAQDFRSCLRAVGASVSVITTQLGPARYGMIATAVMSVSMAPPSLVIGINRSASIYPRILEHGAFAVNYLSADCEGLARDISTADGDQRFAIGTWVNHPVVTDAFSTVSLPHLLEAQATVSCTVFSIYTLGTHGLIVGKVVDVQSRHSGDPLLYCGGNYGVFRDETRHRIAPESILF
jgi:flavin reductase